MFTDALFLIAKNWKRPKYSSIGELCQVKEARGKRPNHL
jgi:hypothetical protein